jgi:hypothetical protein
LLVLWLVIGLCFVAVLGLSALVGFISAKGSLGWHRFDWTVASVFGTALGTTLLAFATGWLANSTRSEVRATQELANLTKRDQDERERPVVIQERADYIEMGPRVGTVEFALRNVGLGPALRVRVRGYYDDEQHPAQMKPATTTIPAIAPGETERREFSVSWEGPPPGDEVHSDWFRLSGDYLDRSRANEYEIIESWGELQPEGLYSSALDRAARCGSGGSSGRSRNFTRA